MPKQQKTTTPEVPAKPRVQVRKCPLLVETLSLRKELRPKLEEFINLKRADVMARFGASDKPFKSGVTFTNEVPGIAHAHLTQDISIVYRIHSNNPKYLDLYGLFKHDELGTGQPHNTNRQKSMARRFANQEFS
jgi:hypothetical protein